MVRGATSRVLWIGGLLVGLLVADRGAPGLDASPAHHLAHAQAPSDACGDRSRLQATAQLALTALRAEGVAALRGCGAVRRCGEAPATVDRHAACIIELSPTSWGFRVRVVPRAASGGPADLQLNVDVAAGTTSQVVVSGSRWAVGRGVAMVGVTEHRLHTHGGEPARIYSARFRAWNDGSVPLPLVLEGGTFVHNERLSALVHASVESASLPPGESEVEVRFDAHDAYQSWNDHFSVEARLRAGGVPLTPRAEWQVTRVSPPGR